MFCQKCGCQNDDGVRFCSQCGTPLIPASQMPTNPQYSSQQIPASQMPTNPQYPSQQIPASQTPTNPQYSSQQIPASQTPTNPQYSSQQIPASQMPTNPQYSSQMPQNPAQQPVAPPQPASGTAKKKSKVLWIVLAVVVLLVAAAAVWYFFLRPSDGEETLEIESIELEYDTISLSIGETYKVEYTLSPEDAEGDLEWESDDETVATVSRKGVVTAVSDGSCSIFVRSESGAEAELEVYVNFSEEANTTAAPEEFTTEDTTAEPETEPSASYTDYSGWRVALITDYGNIDDQSYNQAVFEAGEAWCDARGVYFNYYKPTGDSTAERVASVEHAIDDGFNVLLLPGFAFSDAIMETAEYYPDVYFIGIDITEGDFWTSDGSIYRLPDNVFCAGYRTELSGYMAGYAAVKLGYTHLSFLGGMAVPQVVRYGYGFVQGVNDAAVELGIANEVVIDYVYGNQYYGDADITAYMDNIYANGCEVCFASGGGIYNSAVEAALNHGGKVIGVDVDQSFVIAAAFEEYEAAQTITVTSAMKNLGGTVSYILSELIENDNWYWYGGATYNMGLYSDTDTSLHFACLPDSTQWSSSFTKNDYLTLVSELYWGDRYVSNDIDYAPYVSITVNYLGDIK